MLKFFRRLRRNLLEEGSTKKYILYAGGEVLLVVIGILIALQINNWNEERKDKKDEIVALKDLRQEFVSGQELILLRLYEKREIEKDWKSLLKTIMDKNLTPSEKAISRFSICCSR